MPAGSLLKTSTQAAVAAATWSFALPGTGDADGSALTGIGAAPTAIAGTALVCAVRLTVPTERKRVVAASASARFGSSGVRVAQSNFGSTRNETAPRAGKS